MKHDRDIEIGIMANAIAYVMYGGDPEAPVSESTTGVTTITTEQARLCYLAAERALLQVEWFRGLSTRRSLKQRIQFVWAPKGNVCQKGHSFNTRIPYVSELWWLKHDKCRDE